MPETAGTRTAILLCLLFSLPGLHAQIERIYPKLPKDMSFNPAIVVGDKSKPPYVSESAHYRVESDLSKACSEWAAGLLEKSWPRLRKRFGLSAKPTHGRKKFHVYIHRNREDFEAAIKRESPDLKSHENHGFYSHKTGNLRVWFDPLPVHFCRLLLHEAAHQFHYSSLGPGRGQFRRSPHWYIEGVAHEVERHAWEGRTLKLGVADSCYFPEFATEALEIVGRPRFRLDHFLRGRRTSVPQEQLDSRALGWAVVRFFRHEANRKEREWFNNFERELSRGGGRPRPGRRRGNDQVDRIDHKGVTARMRDFLSSAADRSASQPRGEWSNPSKATYKAHYTGGWYNVLPLAGISSRSTFTASFMLPRKPQPDEGVGFLVGSHNKKQYVVVQVTGDGKQLYIVSRQGEKFFDSQLVKLEGTMRGRVLCISRSKGDTLSIAVDGKEVASRVLPAEQRQGFVALFAEDRSKTRESGPFHHQHFTFMNVSIAAK